MKIKELISMFKKNFYLKYITGNKGKVIETDKKIICFINKKKLIKKDIYCLISYPCKRKINKQICYVIENLEFNKNVTIIIKDNSEIIIKDSIFNFGLDVRTEGKCTIDNCNLNIFNPENYIINVNDLILKNMNYNTINLNYGYNLTIYAKNSLILENTEIFQDNKIYFLIDIIANKKILLINSVIKGKIISLSSPKFNMDNKSLILSTYITKIYSNDFDNLTITSPSIILNGEFINKKTESFILRKVKNIDEQKKLELINCLKNIKNKIESYNQNRLNDYQKKLENKPVKTLLKK